MTQLLIFMTDSVSNSGTLIGCGIVVLVLCMWARQGGSGSPLFCDEREWERVCEWESLLERERDRISAINRSKLYLSTIIDPGPHDPGSWTYHSGLWTYHSGLWTYDPGPWIYNPRLWIYHSGLWIWHPVENSSTTHSITKNKYTYKIYFLD